MLNFIQILFATERMLDSTEGPAQSGRALGGKPRKIEDSPPMAVVVLN
jgi:hypothetical protein